MTNLEITQKLLELEAKLMRNKMERTAIIRQLRYYRKYGKLKEQQKKAIIELGAETAEQKIAPL